ncbi:MAG: transposase [Planctomycetota bacterium]
MQTKKRRCFSESFKRQAVERVVGSGLPIVRVASELDLHETLLRRWTKRLAEPGMEPARRPVVQAQAVSPAVLAAERARLKRDLARARTERDTLREAALIFGAAGW